MATSPQRVPVTGRPSGFGFEAQMRSPDHGRFPGWYAHANRLAGGGSRG
jgi:hypothetical protein